MVALDIRERPEEFSRPSNPEFLDRARFIYLQGDVCDVDLLRSLLSRFGSFHAVYHLAALSGVRYCQKNPEAARRTNVFGTTILLDCLSTACSSNSERCHFVFASSSSIYGRLPTPWSEDAGSDPHLPIYAHTKALAERSCHSLQASNLRITICRFFTVYGPDGRINMAVQSFLSRLNSDRSLPLFGDGSVTRDFTFVYDVVASLIAVLHRSGSDLETVNIGRGSPQSLSFLIDALQSLLQKKARVTSFPPLSEDVPSTHAVVEHARTLGLPPCSVSLLEGLRRTAIHHLKSISCSVIAIVATMPGREVLLQERALCSIARQLRRPDVVVVILDYDLKDPSANALTERLLERNGNEWRLPLHCIRNRRTPKSASGAWNSGFEWVLTHSDSLSIDPHDSFIAVLDDDDEWLPHHLEHCLSKVQSLPGADVVVSGLIRRTSTSSSDRLQSVPSSLRSSDFYVSNPHLQGSNMFLRFSVLLRAGMFDEWLPSCTDRDLMIRILDLGDVRVRTTIDDPAAHSVIHYAEDDRPRLSTRLSEAKLSGLSRFWWKYEGRMSAEQQNQFHQRAFSLFGWNPPPPFVPFSTLSESSPSRPPCVPSRPYDRPVLVGIISDSSSSRVLSLLRDLSKLRHSFCHLDVFILENGPADPNRTLSIGVDLARNEGLRCSLISLEEQRSWSPHLPSWIRPPSSFLRRSIAEMRTFLQIFCWSIASQLSSKPAIWLLDDDKRVDERCFHGFDALERDCTVDVVFGIDEETPPLPAASMIRTQLVLLLFPPQ